MLRDLAAMPRVPGPASDEGAARDDLFSDQELLRVSRVDPGQTGNFIEVEIGGDNELHTPI